MTELLFSAQVTRVTPGKEVCVVAVSDLVVGDSFEHDGKQFTLATEVVPFRSLETGHRVRHHGHWQVVIRRAAWGFLYKLEDPHNPFSNSKGGGNDTPYPGEKMTCLVMKPCVSAT